LDSEGEVRKAAAVSLVVILIVATLAAPVFAWDRGFHHGGFRGHGVVVIGPGCCWDPWWYYPPPYYGYAPPPLVQEPPVYVERPAQPESYWYYCPSTKAYYPSVPTCSEAWIKVPPRPEQ
jgi:hypothetical protein